MASLRAQYEAMTVPQLEDLLRNAVLDPEASTLCKDVINQKIGAAKYSVDPEILATANEQTGEDESAEFESSAGMPSTSARLRPGRIQYVIVKDI